MLITTSAWIFFSSFLAAALVIFFFWLFRKKANFRFCGISLFLVIIIPFLTAVFSVDKIAWPLPFYASMCFGISILFCIYGIIINLAPSIRNYKDRRIVIGMFILASSLNALGEAIRFFFPNSDYLGAYQLFGIMENVISFVAVMSVAALVTYLNFLFSKATWAENKK